MIDEIDRQILQALREDGRASAEAVAERVGLSPTPVRRRIGKLEEAGVIRGYTADVDIAKCGLEISLYVFIKLQRRDQSTIRDFETRVRSLPEIASCDLVTGPFDYILTTHASSMATYDAFLRTVLAELPGIFGIETSVVIGSVKQKGKLPL